MKDYKIGTASDGKEIRYDPTTGQVYSIMQNPPSFGTTRHVRARIEEGLTREQAKRKYYDE